jgi:hypothetical protein
MSRSVVTATFASLASTMIIQTGDPSSTSAFCLRSEGLTKQVCFVGAQGINQSTADAVQKALQADLERRATEARARLAK